MRAKEEEKKERKTASNNEVYQSHLCRNKTQGNTLKTLNTGYEETGEEMQWRRVTPT
jgi:hypothetical protein